MRWCDDNRKQGGVIVSMLSEWFKKFFAPKKQCTENPGIEGLLAIIRILAKVGRGVPLLTAGGSALPALVALGGSAVPDILKLLSEYDDIPCEIEALTADTYTQLMQSIMEEFAFSKFEAKATIASAFRLVTDLKTSSKFSKL